MEKNKFEKYKEFRKNLITLETKIMIKSRI